MKKNNYSTILGKIKEIEIKLNKTEKGEFLFLNSPKVGKIIIKWDELDDMLNLEELEKVEDTKI